MTGKSLCPEVRRLRSNNRRRGAAWAEKVGPWELRHWRRCVLLTLDLTLGSHTALHWEPWATVVPFSRKTRTGPAFSSWKECKHFKLMLELWQLLTIADEGEVGVRNIFNKSSLKVLQMWIVGCFRKTLFWKTNWRNPPRISLEVSLKESKRIFDFDKV